MFSGFSDLIVYLVEPSAVQARMITSVLTQIGVRSVRHFESGGPMFQVLHDAPPSLVISALYLADMQGTELVRLLRQDTATAHTPFILISSETRPHVLDPVRQSGVCGILPKPFTEAQLRTALRATLDYLDTESTLDLDPMDLESLKVLLVDDSPTARGFTRRV